jgi:hypothetical protein
LQRKFLSVKGNEKNIEIIDWNRLSFIYWWTNIIIISWSETHSNGFRHNTTRETPFVRSLQHYPISRTFSITRSVWKFYPHLSFSLSLCFTLTLSLLHSQSRSFTLSNTHTHTHTGNFTPISLSLSLSVSLSHFLYYTHSLTLSLSQTHTHTLALF